MFNSVTRHHYTDGLVQDCGISIADALETALKMA